jgi:ADP-ribose pyrophosphatase YjhB (NUDIX family)
MHVTEAVLTQLRARYGEPRALVWDGEVSADELALAGRSPARRHDVTFFVFNGDRLALIRKPHYTANLWRPPGGGTRPDERFEDGVGREALEELGVEIELQQFLVATTARFRHGSDTIDWRTLVFSARTEADELDPIDRHEIAEARWGTADELAGPIRTALLATRRALWRYRVALHDEALAALRA